LDKRFQRWTLVDLYQDTVSVESEPDRGTTFFLDGGIITRASVMPTVSHWSPCSNKEAYPFSAKTQKGKSDIWQFMEDHLNSLPE
jgi:hypothetical protein